MYEHTFQHVLDLWVAPEIARRQTIDQALRDFRLHAVQVLFNIGEQPKVRLNGEVQAYLRGRPTRPVRAGEHVTMCEFSEVVELRLTPRDPNAGHFTAIEVKGGWAIAFDFRYNRTRVAEMLAVAEQFLDSAELALSRGQLHAAIDNLFSAAELTAKAHLIQTPDKRVIQAKSHGAIHDRLNRERKLGNVEGTFVDSLNCLTRLRSPARYLSGELPVTTEEANGYAAAVRSFLGALHASLPESREVA